MCRLGVAFALLVAQGVLGCGANGEEAESPCADELRDWFGNPVGEAFHAAFYSNLDVDIGETAKLTLTLRNIKPYRQTIMTGFIPYTSFFVTTPDCELVWHSPLIKAMPIIHLPFERWEEKRPDREWSLIDDWGEMVPLGEYLVHVAMPVDGVYARDDYHYDVDYSIKPELMVFKRVRVGENELRAARPEHPPAPAEPCDAGGVSVDMAYIDRVIDENRSTLKDFANSALHPAILGAQLLDENRRPTGALGIRVVTWPPSEWDEPVVVPKCLEGVSVQVVVRPDE